MTPYAKPNPNETDIPANYIDPTLASVGWSNSQIHREYYFTDGRKLAGEQSGTRCFVKYTFLYRDNQHLAIIESRNNQSSPQNDCNIAPKASLFDTGSMASC
ncbi:MAG: hypothetical protein V3V18_10135 [Methylococcales bacterium]